MYSVRYLVSLQTLSGVLNTIGTYDFNVHLPIDQKGMYMPRFVVLFEEEREPLDLV